MARPFEPPGERDLPGGNAGQPPDAFVTLLRSGERDAFIRFFETHRLSVFGLVRCLVPADEAAAVVNETFVVAYRQILLDDGAVDLEARLYRAALAACREHAAPAGSRGEALPAGALALSDDTDLGRRFGQALRTVDEPLAVALLLHDIHGLRPQALAQVFGLSVDAARALLFKAREAFLAAFEATEPERPAACRLAEQVAAGGVGRPAGDGDEDRRLHEHASYCRVCRKVTRSWPAGPFGLALVAAPAPLPAALRVPPVFVPVAAPRREAALGARSALATGGALAAVTLVMTRVGRALASRAAAYTVAAACLVAVAGMAAYVSQLDLRPATPPAPSAAASHSPTAQVPTPASSRRPAASTSRYQGTGSQTAATSGAGTSSGPAVAVVRTVSLVRTSSSTADPGGTSASGGASASNGSSSGSGGGASGGGAGGSALGGHGSGGGRHAGGESLWSWSTTPVALLAHRIGPTHKSWSRSHESSGSRHGDRHRGRNGGEPAGSSAARRHARSHEGGRHASRQSRGGWSHGQAGGRSGPSIGHHWGGGNGGHGGGNGGHEGGGGRHGGRSRHSGSGHHWS